MKQVRSVLVAAIASTILAGCASKPMDINDPDPAIMRLTQIAEDIQRHDNDLNDIELARYIKDYGTPPKVNNARHIPSLKKVVSLGETWSGPIDKLIIKISSIAGLERPIFNGIKPSGDVIVNVNTDYRPLIDILQDAGVQAGSRAKVVVLAKDKKIVTTYVPY